MIVLTFRDEMQNKKIECDFKRKRVTVNKTLVN